MPHDLADVAIVFDLDGTLVDTAGDLTAAMNHALGEAGLAPAPEARVRHLVGHGARAMLARGFEEHGQKPSREEMDAHLAVFLDYYAAHIADHSRAFPEAVPIIDRLRRAGAKTAICTNKREKLSRLLIDALGMTGLFDTIVGMDTAAAAKPDPAPVRLCLERARAKAGVFIGDSDTDVKAAKAAGLPALVAEFGYGPLSLAHEAFATFSDYAALPGLIEKALNR
ncbi:MAG: HAD-IA family hydrolase [Amphiplicatus sp.]